MGRKVLKRGETPKAQHTALYDRITKIQAEVLERIQELKTKAPKAYQCSHLVNSPEASEFNSQNNYYDLYWKQYLLNEIGIRHAKQLQKEVHDFKRKLKKIDVLFDQRQNQLRPFQNRRERVKHYVQCMICQKFYKDEDTLLLHHKIKHETANHEIREGDINSPSEAIFNSESSFSENT